MAYLKEAVEKLSKLPGGGVKKVSDFIRTEPYGVTEQDEFLNGVLEMETLLTPRNCWLSCIGSRQKQTGSVSSGVTAYFGSGYSAV